MAWWPSAVSRSLWVISRGRGCLSCSPHASLSACINPAAPPAQLQVGVPQTVVCRVVPSATNHPAKQPARARSMALRHVLRGRGRSPGCVPSEAAGWGSSEAAGWGSSEALDGQRRGAALWPGRRGDTEVGHDGVRVRHQLVGSVGGHRLQRRGGRVGVHLMVHLRRQMWRLRRHRRRLRRRCARRVAHHAVLVHGLDG